MLLIPVTNAASG